MNTRTKSQVLAERARAHVGCCNNYADYKSCDCLETAIDDMSEQDWLTSKDPAAMLAWLESCPIKPSARKLRLFACACWQNRGYFRTANLPDDLIKNIYEFIDGESQANITILGNHIAGPIELCMNHCRALAFAGDDNRSADLLREIFGNPWQPVTTICPWRFVTTPSNHSRVFDCHVIEGVHEPHCPLAWNNGTIPKIAEAIYAERAFDRMPVLADALEEAGCHASEPCRAGCRVISTGEEFEFVIYQNAGPDSEWVTCPKCRGKGIIENPIIAHLRGPGPHCRGCWVLDLLLGKA